MGRKAGGGRFVVAGGRKGSQGIALEEGKIVDAVSVWEAATMENAVVNDGGRVDAASQQVSLLRS